MKMAASVIQGLDLGLDSRAYSNSQRKESGD